MERDGYTNDIADADATNIYQERNSIFILQERDGENNLYGEMIVLLREMKLCQEMIYIME